MASKVTIIMFCASAVCIQTITAQCIGPIPGVGIEEYAISSNIYGNPGIPQLNCGAPILANPYGFVPSSGGSFAVTSASPIAPTGITVISENAIEGPVTVIGDLPFLGAVAFESALPTAGAGAINYGCGNGVVGIVSENLAAAGPSGVAGVAGVAGPGIFGAGVNAPGLVGSSLAYRGCGL